VKTSVLATAETSARTLYIFVPQDPAVNFVVRASGEVSNAKKYPQKIIEKY